MGTAAAAAACTLSVVLGVGQLGHRAETRPMLMEIWRTANLAHVATYVLADRRREVGARWRDIAHVHERAR